MRYWKPRTIPGDPVVTLAIASYLNDDPRRVDALFCLLYSLKAQTYPNWRAVVVHDGPFTAPFQAYGRLMAFDERVRIVKTADRLRQAGHPHRRTYALEGPGEFVGFANDDVYYCPVYFEWLLSELATHDADLAHCDMVHSHKMWRPLATRPVRGHIDVGGFLARRSLVESTPWTDFSFNGDGAYVEALVRKARKVVKVPAVLYVHN